MNAIVPLKPELKPDTETLDFEGYPLRVFRDGKEFSVAAADVAKMIGHNSTGALTRLLKDGHKGVQNVHTPGGLQKIATITEAGLYIALSQRRGSERTPDEIRERIERFQEWVFGKVLPSIRKTGSYTLPGAQPLTHADILKALMDPEQVVALVVHHAKQTLEVRAEAEAERVAHSETHAHLEDTTKLLRITSQQAAATGRALVVAEEVIAEQAPIIEAFQQFRDTGRAENLSTVARILGMEHSDFFAWVQERGWIFRQGDWLQPCANLRKGKDPQFIVRRVPCHGGQERWQTLVTPIGQFWLHNRLQARKRILAKKAEAERQAAMRLDLFDEGDGGGTGR